MFQSYCDLGAGDDIVARLWFKSRTSSNATSHELNYNSTTAHKDSFVSKIEKVLRDIRGEKSGKSRQVREKGLDK